MAETKLINSNTVVGNTMDLNNNYFKCMSKIYTVCIFTIKERARVSLLLVPLEYFT
jgi:hypothetical protein